MIKKKNRHVNRYHVISRAEKTSYDQDKFPARQAVLIHVI